MKLDTRRRWDTWDMVIGAVTLVMLVVLLGTQIWEIRVGIPRLAQQAALRQEITRLDQETIRALQETIQIYQEMLHSSVDPR